MKRKGFTLIGVLVVVVLMSVVALGIVVYIFEDLRLSISNINQEKALYMAQAAIMLAIVDYEDGTLWDSAQNVNPTGEFYYHLGRDANFLQVDASAPSISAGTLDTIPIKNVNASASITITQMIVEWDFGGNITEVTLGGTSVWSGTATTGQTLDITDFVITSGTAYTTATDQAWTFANSASGDIVVTFIFSDSSTYKLYLTKDSSGITVSGNHEFSITATGEIRSGANVEARRTLVATYDDGTNEITSWQETQNHIIP